MSGFGGRSGASGTSDPDEQAAREFFDWHHRRASISDGDRLVIEPGKVLENIAFAMERVDVDINTPISIEEDVASAEEVMSLIKTLHMGDTLAVHVVNNAMRIMLPRYPAELVLTPLPPEYDLRRLFALHITDEQHAIAKEIFNRRTSSLADLTEDDVAADLEPLDVAEQMAVFVTLFYMYGSKVGAMKHRTGIA